MTFSFRVTSDPPSPTAPRAGLLTTDCGDVRTAAFMPVGTLATVSLPLSLSLLVTLRHAAVLRPLAVVAMGSLAVAALVTAVLSVLHPLDITLLIILFNAAVALAVIGVGRALGPRLYGWAAQR